MLPALMLNITAEHASLTFVCMHSAAGDCASTSGCNIATSQCTPLLSAGSVCQSNGTSALLLFRCSSLLYSIMLYTILASIHLHDAAQAYPVQCDRTRHALKGHVLNSNLPMPILQQSLDTSIGLSSLKSC